jgi:transcriptional regulator with XRE-family HTH domain
MAARQRTSGLGSIDARRLAVEVGREVVAARRSASATQRCVAARAGISPSQLGRIERGELRRPSLDALCRAARGAGLAVSLKLYPDGARLRDAGQLRVLARLDRVVGAPIRASREVRLPIPGDQRAWDVRLTNSTSTASVECEVHLHDIQAVQRRIALKVRDDPGAGIVILLLADTAHHRRVLAEHRESLRGEFPLDSTPILHALRSGRIPPASGILVL